MKLRIHKNSLRLRLDNDDLDRLLDTGSITEELRFGDGSDRVLSYSVETRETGVTPVAEFTEGRIRIYIRREEAANLADDSEVCIEASRSVEGADRLLIQVEKDFLP